MILVTGGAGFIGSNLINELLKKNLPTVLCDYNNKINKHYFENIQDILYFVEPSNLEKFIYQYEIKVIFHLGAISSTTFPDGNKIWYNNIFTSKRIWELCYKKKIRLIYASSAATYGNGDKGFIDTQDLTYLQSLKPLNVYAWTKNEVDKRNIYYKNMLKLHPPQWVSLKFFNVYGPNENHKENMISIVLKTFQQIKKNERTELFKSHNNDFKDGEQKRDFIYVKDCVKVLMWFLEKKEASGIFNVGTGIARTFNDLVINVYKNMNKNINLQYIDMPKEIKNQYQYITKANMKSLLQSGYKGNFYTLEEGIKDYVNNYLNKKYYEIS
tara:strand:+ start:4363 stop:5343 length:981 start_codon:yes stop_codon:yes gene_type:complete